MEPVIPSPRRRWTKKHLGLAAGIATLAIVVGLVAFKVELRGLVDSVILHLRELGPLAFFGAMALLPAVGFPLLAFTLTAWPVFGPVLGAGWVIVFSLLAVVANLLLTYWLAHRALRPLVTRLLAYFGFRLPESPADSAWQLTLIVRLTPGPPFWAQSYLLGLIRVPLAPYLVVSTSIIASYIVALVFGGEAIASGNGQLAFAAVGLLGVSFAGLRLLHKRAIRRRSILSAKQSAMSPSPTAFPPLRITFGADNTAGFDPGLPVLAGETVEALFNSARPAGRAGALTLFQAGDWLIGAATLPLAPGLEEAAQQLYNNIFQATQGRHLARVWNYVPAINAPGLDQLENYRIFCRGRSLAFEQHYGRSFNALLPSASAVGSKADALTVVFAASSIPPCHVENPLQVPAYDYPGDYGPRAPSFARATLVPGADTTVFISGTAAIRGHATVAPHDLPQQLTCTLENLREISAACGLGPDLDQGGRSTRHFKVYLRHAADQPLVAARLEAQLLQRTDRVSYLQADICRAELLVEIEATLFEVNSSR